MGKDTGMGGLVLKGLGFGLAKRFRWFGGICAPRDCSLWWVVVTLPLGTAQPPCTYRKRTSTARSPSRCTSVARLVGGLPNPHPRWVGSWLLLGSSQSARPGFTGVVCSGTHHFRFHFTLPNSLNKALSWFFRSLFL